MTWQLKTDLKIISFIIACALAGAFLQSVLDPFPVYRRVAPRQVKADRRLPLRRK